MKILTVFAVLLATANAQLRLNWKSSADSVIEPQSTVQIRVIDLNGQPVGSFAETQFQQESVVMPSYIPRGTYYARIIAGNGALVFDSALFRVGYDGKTTVTPFIRVPEFEKEEIQETLPKNAVPSDKQFPPPKFHISFDATQKKVRFHIPCDTNRSLKEYPDSVLFYSAKIYNSDMTAVRPMGGSAASCREANGKFELDVSSTLTGLDSGTYHIVGVLQTGDQYAPEHSQNIQYSVRKDRKN